MNIKMKLFLKKLNKYLLRTCLTIGFIGSSQIWKYAKLTIKIHIYMLHEIQNNFKWKQYVLNELSNFFHIVKQIYLTMGWT